MKINRECVCKVCNTTFQNAWKFIEHLQQVHNLTIVDYCAKYEPMYCFECGKLVTTVRKNPYWSFVKYGSPFKMMCSGKCQRHKSIIKSHSIKRVITDEQREKQRQKRLKYLAEHPENSAWNRRNKRDMSSLEKWFYNKCVEFDLVSKYDIVRELLEYPYYIDFAFVNCKVAVELDGQTHFKYQTNIEHDKKKTKLLQERGWHVYRIAYFEVNDNAFIKFLEFLQHIVIDCPKVLEQRLVSYQEYKNAVEYKIHNRQSKWDLYCEYKTLKSGQLQILHTAIEQCSIEQLDANIFTIDCIKTLYQTIIKRRQLAKTIDRTKNGWVVKVGNLWQYSSQRVRSYMKTYMPDLLENTHSRQKYKS